MSVMSAIDKMNTIVPLCFLADHFTLFWIDVCFSACCNRTIEQCEAFRCYESPPPSDAACSCCFRVVCGLGGRRQKI